MNVFRIFIQKFLLSSSKRQRDYFLLCVLQENEIKRKIQLQCISQDKKHLNLAFPFARFASLREPHFCIFNPKFLLSFSKRQRDHPPFAISSTMK